MALTTMIGVVPIFNLSSATGGNSIRELAELSEVDACTFVVDRSQPTLIFCDPVDTTDARCVVSFTARVSSIFGLRYRPQVFNPVIVSNAVDVVDKVWVSSVYKFPDNPVRYPDHPVGSDANIPLGVEAPCGFSCKDLSPWSIVGARVPKQLSRVRGVSEDFQQFDLRWQGVGGHTNTPCGVGTSVIDPMGNVKEFKWH